MRDRRERERNEEGRAQKETKVKRRRRRRMGQPTTHEKSEYQNVWDTASNEHVLSVARL